MYTYIRIYNIHICNIRIYVYTIYMYAIYVYTYIAYMYIVYTYIQYIQERQAHDEIAAVAMERVAEELKVIYYLSTSHTFFL